VVEHFQIIKFIEENLERQERIVDKYTEKAAVMHGLLLIRFTL
jgi:hypothetical protein